MMVLCIMNVCVSIMTIWGKNTCYGLYSYLLFFLNTSKKSRRWIDYKWMIWKIVALHDIYREILIYPNAFNHYWQSKVSMYMYYVFLKFPRVKCYIHTSQLSEGCSVHNSLDIKLYFWTTFIIFLNYFYKVHCN